VPKDKLNYIMGNPPFVGAKLTTENQRNDRIFVFNSEKYGKLDYVACWYKKASDFMVKTNISCAFVSTNSIVQGEQVELLWKPLVEKGVKIYFAHKTFQWDSETSAKAHVYCIIVGFSYAEHEKYLFENNIKTKCKYINSYLMPNTVEVFLPKRKIPICKIPHMTKGSQLIDNGNFVFTAEEMKNFVLKYPESKDYFYEYINADSFINNREKTYCLCLKGCSPNILHSCVGIKKVVEEVYQYRINSSAISTKKLANRPSEFFITNIPQNNSILIPVVSSEKRKYIPMGYIKNKVIYTNASNYIDSATVYEFGVLTSNVHMAWVKAVCGRLESRYRYSKDIVYNNFPWCNPTAEQRAKIEQTAQNILDVRAKYPECSLADLYDETTMPPDLRKAHQLNDFAVMTAYGFDKKITESECVALLMKMYQKLMKTNQ
jgi:hypothetical protein